MTSILGVFPPFQGWMQSDLHLGDQKVTNGRSLVMSKWGWPFFAYQNDEQMIQKNYIPRNFIGDFLFGATKRTYFRSMYLEPQWPLFLKVNPPKQGPFQSKQGSFGFNVTFANRFATGSLGYWRTNRAHWCWACGGRGASRQKTHRKHVFFGA